MDAAADRPEFAPPQERDLGRGFVFAVLAHVLLAVGLTQAVKWQRTSQDVAVEAELWSAVPQQAAPKEVAPPPPPPAPPPPAPAPVVKAPPLPDPQVQRDAQIALEREKQKREALERKREEEERERAEQRRQEIAKKKREEELAKKKQQQEQAKLLAETRRKEEEKKRKEQEVREAREAERVAKLREENLRRMQGMAGTGAPTSTGAAAQSSGPSASWGARVQARVRPNIVFTDHVEGNPEAVVEVRLAPDGTIVSRRIKKSSGTKSWDEAVLRALDRTETLPRDTDGRVPSGGDLVFRPKG